MDATLIDDVDAALDVVLRPAADTNAAGVVRLTRQAVAQHDAIPAALQGELDAALAAATDPAGHSNAVGAATLVRNVLDAHRTTA